MGFDEFLKFPLFLCVDKNLYKSIQVVLGQIRFALTFQPIVLLLSLDNITIG